MQSFARATKLTNIGGRADYISNPDRQEQIVAKSAPVDWTDYQQFEQAKQKTLTDQRHIVDGKEVVCKSRSIEGREIVLALPNEWAKLGGPELSQRADHLAHMVAGDGRDVQWAVHWNKTHTNLHLHVVFSERQRIAEPGRWDRDIYLTAEGKVARTKADRAKKADGTDEPPVHKKGELKDSFSTKDPRFKRKGWLHELKGQLREEMQQRWDVKFDARGLLHEYHEGKGSDAPLIREKNEAIRVNNANYAQWQASFPEIPERSLKRLMVESAKAGKVLLIVKQPDGQLAHGQTSVKKWRAADEQDKAKRRSSKTPAQAAPAPEPQQQLVTPEAAEPAAPFADLLEAQKELYRQTFALHDSRKPLDMSEIQRAADIRSVAQDLTSALDSSARAWERQRAIKGLFKGKEKKAAQSDRYAADRRAEKALEKLGKLGVNTRIGGILPNLSIHHREDFEGLSARAKEQAADIENEAYRVARPKDALKGSQEATRAAEERFKALCREIPPEQRSSAKMALEAHENEYHTKGRAPFAENMAHAAVFGVRNRLLAGPEQERQERQKEKVKSQGRGYGE